MASNCNTATCGIRLHGIRSTITTTQGSDIVTVETTEPYKKGMSIHSDVFPGPFGGGSSAKVVEILGPTTLRVSSPAATGGTDETARVTVRRSSSYIDYRFGDPRQNFVRYRYMYDNVNTTLMPAKYLVGWKMNNATAASIVNQLRSAFAGCSSSSIKIDVTTSCGGKRIGFQSTAIPSKLAEANVDYQGNIVPPVNYARLQYQSYFPSGIIRSSSIKMGANIRKLRANEEQATINNTYRAIETIKGVAAMSVMGGSYSINNYGKKNKLRADVDVPRCLASGGPKLEMRASCTGYYRAGPNVVVINSGFLNRGLTAKNMG